MFAPTGVTSTIFEFEIGEIEQCLPNDIRRRYQIRRVWI